MRHLRPALVALTVVLVVAALAGSALAGPASAQDPTPTDPPSDDTRSTDVDSPLGEIIPKPNSGTAPEDAGDPGGALQLTLFGLVVVFLGFVAWRITASARRARAGTAPPSRTPRPRRPSPE